MSIMGAIARNCDERNERERENENEEVTIDRSNEGGGEGGECAIKSAK